MSAEPSDAEPAPLTTGCLIPPRHPPVWIRLAGAWHAGEVESWYRADMGHGVWCVMIRTDGARSAYRYDPASIRPRREAESGPGFA